MLDTDPEAYLKMGRVNIFLASMLIILGLVLVGVTLEPGKSLIREAASQIGFAALTAAFIDLIFFAFADRYKKALTKDITSWAKSMNNFDSTMNKLMSSVDSTIAHFDKKTFQDKVELDLDLIKIELESIHYDVSPSYRDLKARIEKEKEQKQGPSNQAL